MLVTARFWPDFGRNADWLSETPKVESPFSSRGCFRKWPAVGGEKDRFCCLFYCFISSQNLLYLRNWCECIAKSNPSASCWRLTRCLLHFFHAWKICILEKQTTEVILVGWFGKCQSIKKVGGRRFVEGLSQALFSFRLARRNVITKRNENWAWSQVTLVWYCRVIHLFQFRLLSWTMFYSLQCTMVNPFVAGSLVLFTFIKMMKTISFKTANGC